MLYYDKIDVSEGIDVNKTSSSKEYDVCHNYYFLNYSFKFQSNVCNRSYDLSMMSINLSDITILYIKGSDYRCIISLISKNKAVFYQHKTPIFLGDVDIKKVLDTNEIFFWWKKLLVLYWLKQALI